MKTVYPIPLVVVAAFVGIALLPAAEPPKTRTTSVFTDKAFKSNGLAFDAAGNLLACDGADGGGRCVRRWNLKTGTSEIVADRYKGKRLNSPNDLVVDLKGR